MLMWLPPVKTWPQRTRYVFEIEKHQNIILVTKGVQGALLLTSYFVAWISSYIAHFLCVVITHVYMTSTKVVKLKHGCIITYYNSVDDQKEMLVYPI